LKGGIGKKLDSLYQCCHKEEKKREKIEKNIKKEENITFSY